MASSLVRRFSARPVPAAAGLLALTTIAAWHHTFGVPFLFDDPSSIAENPTIKRLWPLTVPVSPPEGGYTVSGRPLLNLSLAINWAISGEAVWSYHAANLLIHILGGLTLFGVIRRTLQLRRFHARLGKMSAPVAALTAAWWLLHPLQTESVTYIVQRAEALVGLFYLLTLYCFIRGATSEGDASVRAAAPPRTRWHVLAAAACLLGMASKEVMVSAPLIVFLYDRTFVSGSWRAAWQRHRALYLGLATTWLLLGWLVAGSGGDRGGTVGIGLGGISWWTSLLTQCEAIGGYLRRALWPSGLIFDYGTDVVTSLAAVWPQALLLVALAAATAWAVWSNHPLGVAGVWFFAILAPSSSVIPVATQTIAEHRMYLPLAGIVVPAALASYAWLGRRSVFLLAAIALGLGGATYARNTDYRTRLSIFTDTVAKRPDNPRARNDLGNAFFLEDRVHEAIAQYREVLRRKPDFPKAHYNLGNALLKLQRRAEAIAHFERALAVDPNYALARLQLGRALMRARRVGDALPHLEAGVRLRPADALARADLAEAFALAGRDAEAESNLAEARRLDPSLAAQLNTEANELLAEGSPDDAATRYRTALRLDPNLVEARINLANVLSDQDRLPEAIAEYETALRVRPDDADAHNNLGRLLAQSGRVRDALPYFAEAARLRPTDPGMLLNLANAHLVLGNRADAQRHFEAVLRLDPNLAPAREMLEALRAAP